MSEQITEISARVQTRLRRKHRLAQRKWRRLKTFLLCILSAALLFSGVHIVLYYTEGSEAARLNEAVRQAYYQTGSVTDDGISGLEEADDSTLLYMQRFALLKALNDDAVGWIYIEGTGIDHPVVRGSNNEHYLRRDIEKKRSSRGSIFLDCRNSKDPTDKHFVVYGHNMRDGSMFADLLLYSDAPYLRAHPIIEFNIGGTPTSWEIFSVRNIGDTPLPISFSKDVSFDDFLHAISHSSLYETGVSVSSDDQILSLSTCSHRARDRRFVVHAKKVD